MRGAKQEGGRGGNRGGGERSSNKAVRLLQDFRGRRGGIVSVAFGYGIPVVVNQRFQKYPSGFENSISVIKKI